MVSLPVVHEGKYDRTARTPPGLLERQTRLVREAPFLDQVGRAFPGVIFILNHERQCVYTNEAALRFLDKRLRDEITGQRPGELLRCINANEGRYGCGTHAHCNECGAFKSIMFTIAKGASSVHECRIRTITNESFDLLATTSPLVVEGQQFTLLALSDISHQKRRLALERTFFHDIANCAAVIDGCVQLLALEGVSTESQDLVEMLSHAVKRLDSEISSQRQLARAETQELPVVPSSVEVSECFAELISGFSNNKQFGPSTVVVAADSDAQGLTTDRNLLMRVLENMVKNALEASPPRSVITLRAREHQGYLLFEVHNPGVIPEDAQRQMFQRSFSTKGPGRGVGTYSMKLFGEQYLSGEVGFESTEAKGTTFFLKVPSTLVVTG